MIKDPVVGVPGDQGPSGGVVELSGDKGPSGGGTG